VTHFAASDADRLTSSPSSGMWPCLPRLAAHITMMQSLKKNKNVRAVNAFPNWQQDTTKYQQATYWQF